MKWSERIIGNKAKARHKQSNTAIKYYSNQTTMSSTNIKSWADASSDSESEDERIAPPPSNLPGSDSYAALQAAEEAEAEAHEYGDGGFPGRRLEDMPTQPPYTAFVGNLHRGMEREDFEGEMERMLVDRACQTESGTPVKIVGTRLINDRATGQSKGFGYVEFGTPEELLAFLNLGFYQISGRNLKVDIASGEPRNPRGGGDRQSDRRRSGRGGRGDGRNYDRQYSNDSYRSANRDNDAPIDGSQFQGGRYSRSTSNMSQGSMGGSGRGGMPRNGSGMMKRSDSSASAGSASQRPSLKLAPRTKPLEESGSGSRSSIFGDAKPRDEKEFEDKKAAEAAEKEEGLKKVTSSMSDLEVVKETNGTDEKDASDAKDGEKSEKTGESKTLNRKPSRGAGRGGDRPERNNGDRRRDGRKSGRGEGRGGRGDRRNSERGGRGESGKRPSVKSNGDAAKDGEAPVSSLAAAAAMPVKQESKAPPKKANSFAAFMDSDDEE